MEAVLRITPSPANPRPKVHTHFDERSFVEQKVNSFEAAHDACHLATPVSSLTSGDWRWKSRRLLKEIDLSV